MRETLEQRIALWLDDPESSVEYAEQVEDQWAVRMRQTVRDATTVWFRIGERSLSYQAYVIPGPERPGPEHHLALVRNRRSWRAFFAVDEEGAFVLRGRLLSDRVTLEELDMVLGEIYEMVEVSFRSFIEIAKNPPRNL